MKKNSVIYIISIFIILSCTKELPIKEVENNSLSINSLITPDSIVEININSISSMNETPVFVDDAKISFYQNDSFLTELAYNNNGWYKSFFYPQTDKNYKIKIEHNNKTYTAKTYIPSKTIIKNATIKFTDNYNENQEPISTIKISFYDNKETNNYYELIFFHNLNEYGRELLDYFNFYNMNEAVVLNEGDWQFQPTSIFFSDELFNGDTLNMKFDVLIMPYCENNNLYAELRSISKSYYLYRKYWTRHYFNQQNDEHVDDPLMILFQGEPIEMYSNINAGYGIFAGYSSDIKKIECLN